LKFSLTARLLLAGTIVLTAFLGLTGLTLDRAFSDYAEKSLQEQIQAQTVGLVAAAVLDKQNELGRIHAGYTADLVAVRENPLESISALRNPAFVMKAGRVYQPVR